MKKCEFSPETLTKVVRVITDEKQLTPANLAVNGQVIPTGTRFQFVGVADVAASGRIPQYQGVYVELEGSHAQVPVSVRTLNGVFFTANAAEKKNERQQIETLFNKSGKNIYRFVEENKEKVFVAGEPKEFQTYRYGQDTISNARMMTYDEAPEAPEMTKK